MPRKDSRLWATPKQELDQLGGRNGPDQLGRADVADNAATAALNSGSNMNEKVSRRDSMRLFTIEAVAQELSVSQKTIRRWIETRELPSHRLGRQIRISEGDLRNFLAARRQT
jgi:excisionase family DNA binding protein